MCRAYFIFAFLFTSCSAVLHAYRTPNEWLCGVLRVLCYSDCVCACAEMFVNLQFTRSTNSIEFYVYHQPVIMTICAHTKNIPFYILYIRHSGKSFIFSLSFSLPLFLFRQLTVKFTLECQAYKQYLCIN